MHFLRQVAVGEKSVNFTVVHKKLIIVSGQLRYAINFKYKSEIYKVKQLITKVVAIEVINSQELEF